MADWIKLHRKILDWGWYSDTNVFRVFIHCLLMAQRKDCKYKGVELKPGQFSTGTISMAEKLGLSRQQIRTALKKLQDSGEINQQSTSRYTVITINNWEQYQFTNQQITNNQPTNNQQITTIQEYREENNNNNTTTIYTQNENEKILILGNYNNVSLTAEQYNQFKALCNGQDKANEIINSLSENIETGKEKPYMAQFPNAHFIRLQKYLDFRKKNPSKFIAKQKTIQTKADIIAENDKLIDAWFAKYKQEES